MTTRFCCENLDSRAKFWEQIIFVSMWTTSTTFTENSDVGHMCIMWVCCVNILMRRIHLFSPKTDSIAYLAHYWPGMHHVFRSMWACCHAVSMWTQSTFENANLSFLVTGSCQGTWSANNQDSSAWHGKKTGFFNILLPRLRWLFWGSDNNVDFSQ